MELMPSAVKAESKPLDLQGSPSIYLLYVMYHSDLKPLNEDPSCFRQEVNYVDLALTQLKQIVIKQIACY